MKNRWIVLSSLLVALAVSGCANPGASEREQSSHAFETNLIAETERVMAESGGMLTLSNSVALARERTLKLAGQDLEAKLARITRAAAFSAFLPTVALSGSSSVVNGGIYGSYLGDITTGGAAGSYSGMLSVAQPVFTPVAWIMFAETKYGVRIKDIVRERAVQLLDVQVAALFYRAAVAARTVGVRERQLESGRALTNRVARLCAEGLVLDADRVRAEARCAVDEAALTKSRHDCAAASAQLADILRLWPLAEIPLDGESIRALPPLPEKSVEEWVWEGLVTRKDLYAGDQTVELRKARVIEALAGFLPNVVLGGGGANLTIGDVAARGWYGSLIGSWAIFEGFRTVQEYRAAKAQRETEFKLQEDRMLAVVVAVADSWRNLQYAREQARAACTWAEAARLDCVATERRFEDGQETFSAVLDKRAVRDDAEVKAVQAAYAEALAGVMLRQAVGVELFQEVECK